MLDIRLSTRVERGFSAVRMASTRVVQLRNGHERRNANWASKKRRYTSKYGAFTQDMLEELLAFSEIADGQANAFRFKDWSDWRAYAQPLGTAPASGTTPVQLVRTYTRGAYSKVRTITKPVAGTVVVYVDGTPKAGTVDDLTGLWTPSTAWSGGTLTADFQFDVPVRFATDEIEFVLPDRDIFEVNADLIEVFGE